MLEQEHRNRNRRKREKERGKSAELVQHHHIMGDSSVGDLLFQCASFSMWVSVNVSLFTFVASLGLFFMWEKRKSAGAQCAVTSPFIAEEITLKDGHLLRMKVTCQCIYFWGLRRQGNIHLSRLFFSVTFYTI